MKYPLKSAPVVPYDKLACWWLSTIAMNIVHTEVPQHTPGKYKLYPARCVLQRDITSVGLVISV